MSPRGKRVTASEIGQYAFCARAWWLRSVDKIEPINSAALERGTAAHERHGWQVALARRVRQLALTLLGLAALSMAVWGVVRLL